MTRDELIEAAARAMYDELEGPINNQDAERQMRQWLLCKGLARAALAVFEAEGVESP